MADALEELVRTLDSVLSDKFDLPSPKAEIKYHSSSDASCYYEPKTNQVHVPENVGPADFIHEYYGHAFFNNYSHLGRVLTSMESEMDVFERQYGLPKNSKVEVVNSGCVPKIEKNINGAAEYRLHCNLSDKSVCRYLKLKSEYNKLFEETRPLQEGFAMFMEQLLLGSLGPGIASDRLTEISGSDYYAYLSKFLEGVNADGLFTTFYSLGLPKSTRPDIVAQYAIEHLKDVNGLKLLVMYGSGKRDIDLLAVYDDKSRQKSQLYDGNIDLNVVGEKEFMERVARYDIELLEPLLNGNLVMGDKGGFESLRSWVIENKPSVAAAEYSRKRAFETYTSAEFYLDQHRYDARRRLIWGGSLDNLASAIHDDEGLDVPSRDLTHAINNLAFSLSYLNSSVSYQQGRLYPHRAQLEEDNLLKQITAYLKEVENSEVLPSRKKVLGFLSKENFEKFLFLKSFSIFR